MSKLPIEHIKDEFLALLPQHHLVVEADTGSGKSTRLPLWIANSDNGNKVLVVEPRRIACVALATYVAELAHTSLGQKVGYAIRFDQQFCHDTQIVFVTPGIALRWLADNQLTDYATVMIDEFHERRWDTDLLLALLHQKNQHRLLITSATVRGQQLADYLGGKRLRSEGKLFPVEVTYQAQHPQQMPTTATLDLRIQQACDIAIQQLNHAQKNHDILVFLPGKKEIHSAAQQLRDINAEVISLSASASAKEQHRALNPVAHQHGDTKSHQQRRIILSTNVAETSLTIPNIGAVIDSGMERRTHQRNGRTVLGLDPISKASADQRKGRAGRLFSGFCIRLWGEHAPLTDTTAPEILREELTELVLAAACSQVSIGDLKFPEALPTKSLDVATSRLLAMTAIHPSGRATEHGKKLYPLPIDTLFSHLITAMPNDSCKAAMVDLVAALSVQPTLISIPKSEQGRRALAQWERRDCDVTTFIRALRQSAPNDIMINTKARTEARNLSQQIRRSLQLPALKQLPATHKKSCPEALDFDHQELINSILQVAPELVFVRREKRRHALGNGYNEAIIGDKSRLQDNVEACIVFDQHSIPGKGVRDTLSVATCIAPIKPQDIIQAHLHTEQLGNIHWKHEELLVTTQQIYAGRVIGKREVSPQGSQAREAITQLILDNRLFPALGKALQEDIDAFQLYLALNPTQDSVSNASQNPNADITSAATWLLQKLQRLGVESSDDLQLIDRTDLHFEGIPEWEKQPFLERFPQQLTLSDISLSVHYALSNKQITVEKIAGDRKTDPKRWELPSWKGWRIRYKKASRVVDIR